MGLSIASPRKRKRKLIQTNLSLAVLGIIIAIAMKRFEPLILTLIGIVLAFFAYNQLKKLPPETAAGRMTNIIGAITNSG